jgi:molecular chaperone GrpE
MEINASTEELVAGNKQKAAQGEEALAEKKMAGATQGEESAAMAPGVQENGDDQKQLIATLETEKKDLQDKLLRLAAEFDNFKKRMLREQETAFKYAEEGLLKELLPSIDNLERALAHQNGTDDVKTMREGVDLTLKALLSATAKFGLTAIDSVGQPFDPNLHEALVMEASDTVPAQSVLREFERGYFYKDRLLRAAKVVVAKACE